MLQDLGGGSHNPGGSSLSWDAILAVICQSQQTNQWVRSRHYEWTTRSLRLTKENASLSHFQRDPEWAKHVELLEESLFKASANERARHRWGHSDEENHEQEIHKTKVNAHAEEHSASSGDASIQPLFQIQKLFFFFIPSSVRLWTTWSSVFN